MRKTSSRISHNELAAFEEYLFSLMKDADESKPLTTDEVVAILRNYGPPEEISENERETLVKLMKDAHEAKHEVERKLKNPSSIHSFGELIKLFCVSNNVSAVTLACLLNLSEEEFEAFYVDRAFPRELGKDRILNFAALAGLAMQDMIAILDKTVTLLKLKPTTNFAAGHARADKNISESKRVDIMDDARKELLLALNEPKTTVGPNDDWKTFRDELVQSISEENTILGETSQCLTIRDESRRNFTNPVRQRFSLSHELGHYFLDHPDASEEIPDDDGLAKRKLYESEADEFAAELLLPREMLKTALKEGAGMEALQAKFQVSRHVVAIQLSKHGFLTKF